MKEKVKVPKQKKEKRVDFLAMWKSFWNEDSVEEMPEDSLANSEDLTPEQKAALLGTLEKVEKNGNKRFRDSYIAPLNKKAKESAEKALEENSINIDSKTRKVIKNNKSSQKENNGDTSKATEDKELEI